MNLKHGEIEVRKFLLEDVEKKVKWINDSNNNKFLHYDLPLEYEKTACWYKRISDSTERFDGTILYDDTPVGLIGLLNIDKKNLKAEYYICLGEKEYKGKGIALIASKMLIDYAFTVLKLNKVYLYTEEENTAAQKLFERLGFEREGLLKDDLVYNGRHVNRYVYGILERDWNDK